MSKRIADDIVEEMLSIKNVAIKEEIAKFSHGLNSIESMLEDLEPGEDWWPQFQAWCYTENAFEYALKALTCLQEAQFAFRKLEEEKNELQS